MLPEMFNSPVKLGDDLPRHGHVRRVGLKIVPQLRYKDEFLGRRKLLDLWKLFKYYAAIIAIPECLAMAGLWIRLSSVD